MSYLDDVNRGLDGLVKKSSYRDWVNPEDKLDKEIAKEFRALPVSQHEVKDAVSESVDGLPVKDRDLVEDGVDAPKIGEEFVADNVVVEQNSEVSHGILQAHEPVEYLNENRVSTEGTVKEVLDQVGDDVDLAQVALEDELSKDSPRKSLVEKLETIIGE